MKKIHLIPATANHICESHARLEVPGASLQQYATQEITWYCLPTQLLYFELHREKANLLSGTRLIYFGLPILETDRAKSTRAGQVAGWADGWLQTPLHTLPYLCWLQSPVVPFSIPRHTQSSKHNTRVLQQ